MQRIAKPWTSVQFRHWPPNERRNMPVRRVKGGYKYGNTGKVYKSKAKAQKQGLAIRLSQKRAGKKIK